MTQSQRPAISVIVVAHDQEDTIAACLESIVKLDYEDYDVIAVDDCSLDGTVGIIKQFPVQLIRLERQGGAAQARNKGAERSCADILLFVDSDVIVAQNALAHIQLSFESSPGVQAVQGVYSGESVSNTIATRYKDHFDAYKNRGITNDSVKVISTYCFAIKRKVFWEVGGFDIRIQGATVEDNDLGFRLFASGNRVRLNRNVIVTHLKRYSLRSLLKRDYIVSFHMVKFFLRVRSASGGRRCVFGIPLSCGGKTSAVFAASIVLSLIILVFGVLWVSSGFALYYCLPLSVFMLTFVLINMRYLLLLFKTKGWRFCFVWALLFYLDMLSASFGVLNGGIDYLIFRRRY